MTKSVLHYKFPYKRGESWLRLKFSKTFEDFETAIEKVANSLEDEAKRNKYLTTAVSLFHLPDAQEENYLRNAIDKKTTFLITDDGPKKRDPKSKVILSIGKDQNDSDLFMLTIQCREGAYVICHMK